jgi:predicted lipoprotein with Yx(FWY)xxD motif
MTRNHATVVPGKNRSAEIGGPWRLGLRLAGAGLLLAVGGIHLDLYLTGYRNIPTIGWLFLLQLIVAFAVALAVLVTGSRLAAAAGAGFALATLGGYLLSIWFGLFGFKEVRTTAGIVAGVVEVAAFAVLAVLAAYPGAPADTRAQPAGSRWTAVPARLDGDIPHAWAAVAGVCVVALVLLGVAVAGAGGTTSTATTSAVKVVRIGAARVLANAQGRTLYWFAPDTPTKSVCNGSCASYWPPVAGPLKIDGVSGRFGTIKRADGSVQATYNRHPLYTYVGDSGPGQAHGNNLNLNGGLWHEVTVSG